MSSVPAPVAGEDPRPGIPSADELGSRRGRFRTRPVPEGIRITKVGLWYVLFTVIVSIAATNTGNNALYMVLALMLGVLVASGLLSRQNVRGLEVVLEAPGEIYANRPFHLHFRLRNRGGGLPRWLLLFSVSRKGRPLLVPYLPRRGHGVGDAELILPRRGRISLDAVHVSSLFPFGFFRKGVRYPVELPLLVYPEIFPAASSRLRSPGTVGEEPTHRAGRGHELYTLRGFRHGDDPRGIHWKQTARTGDMVFMEREAETGRRLAILFDNGVGTLADSEELRFERLVSEAATAALDYLARGYQVELVSRDRMVGFGRGRQHRHALLEALALVQPVERSREPLRSTDPSAPQLRLGMGLQGGVEVSPATAGVRRRRPA